MKRGKSDFTLGLSSERAIDVCMYGRKNEEWIGGWMVDDTDQTIDLRMRLTMVANERAKEDKACVVRLQCFVLVNSVFVICLFLCFYHYHMC